MTHVKSVSEYELCRRPQRSKKGMQGFVKAEIPKDAKFTFRLDASTNKFIEDYCAINSISKTQLMLASLQCYTGYNGKNGRQIIKELKLAVKDYQDMAL